MYGLENHTSKFDNVVSFSYIINIFTHIRSITNYNFKQPNSIKIH